LGASLPHLTAEPIANFIPWPARHRLAEEAEMADRLNVEIGRRQMKDRRASTAPYGAMGSSLKLSHRTEHVTSSLCGRSGRPRASQT
jgi:hypothetical protein